MAGGFREVLCALLAAAALGGCAPRIVITGPPSNAGGGAGLWVGGAPAPRFAWVHEGAGAGGDVDYTLVVAADRSFAPASVRLRVERLRRLEHTVQPGQGWLPGDATYWVDVIATRYVDGGEETIACEQKHSFQLAARDRVKVKLTPPAAPSGGRVEVRVGTREPHRATSTLEVELEEGERVPLEVVRTLAPLAAGLAGEIRIARGELSVVKVNDNIRSQESPAAIVIDNLDDALLDRVAGGTAAELRYLLGGEEIVRLRLGSR